jgi:ATP-dependent RNA helicase SUPV3L1/SUV3
MLNRLGFRIIPAATLAETSYGPPAPPMLARRKGVKTAAKPAPLPAEVKPDNPFAALAALRKPASRGPAPRGPAPRRVAPRRAAS